jgi:hypothetical protein
MKMTRTIALPSALIAALLFSASAMAASHEADEHDAHHPAETEAAAPQDAVAERMQAMRAHMQQMRETRDPEARMKLMEDHMANMAGMMENMPAMCRMMSGGKGMVPGMGPGMDQGMMRHGRSAMHHELMHQRVEALEKRLDLMQMMMMRSMMR